MKEHVIVLVIWVVRTATAVTHQHKRSLQAKAAATAEHKQDIAVQAVRGERAEHGARAAAVQRLAAEVNLPKVRLAAIVI